MKNKLQKAIELIELLQWGSCDGCGALGRSLRDDEDPLLGFCPICSTENAHPHAEDCIVGKTLAELKEADGG